MRTWLVVAIVSPAFALTCAIAAHSQSNSGSKTQLPPHAKPLVYGSGWTCERGFRKVQQQCVEVVIPANAELGALGDDWRCKRGFRRMREECLAVVIPENAQLSALGDGWTCKRGFRKSQGQCVTVDVPPNARLSALGDAWECNRGFSRTPTGCQEVEIPANALLNVLGSGWECKPKYKRDGARCIEMSADEIAKQAALAQAIRRKIEAGRQAILAGGDCEVEYRSGAEVCIEVTDASIECNKSYAGQYYSDCNVEIDYQIETNYPGRSSVQAQVECSVEIEYKGRGLYTTRSDSDSDSSSHILYKGGSDSGNIEFNFDFTSLEQPTSVEISSAECEVTSVDLY
jgi:hypothetical protein